MDANGTRYHLLLGRADWGRCLQDGRALAEAWDTPEATPPGFAWDATRADLTLRPQLFHFIAAPLDTAPTLADRRGAARDRYGNFYWVHKDGKTVRVRSSGSKTTSDFWPVAPPPATQELGDFGPTVTPVAPPAVPLGGMTVTAHHYLVVGTLAPAGLLVFDLHAGGPPLQLAWPEDVPFAPFDLSADAQGGLWILDRDHRRLWKLDAQFQVVPLGVGSATAGVSEDFQPVDPHSPRRPDTLGFPEATRLDASSPLVDVDPISVEALPDGRVLVLDRGTDESRLLLLRDGEVQGAPVTLSLDGFIEPEGPSSDFQLAAHDMAFVPQEDGTLGRIVVASSEGNQSFAFELHEANGQLVATPQMDYLPMRLFAGKAVIAADGQAWYDLSDKFVPLMAARRPRYLPEATLLTPVLDGRTPDCVWHRMFLDASLPAGATVRVRTRAANTREELETASFSAEPELHQRPEGSELPFAPKTPGCAKGTYELLFQRAQGRYAQLELTLSGAGSATPRLHALRVWYPRFSYVEQYLPGVYRQDKDASGFLERFLANTEGFFTTIEDRIAAVQVLFDPRSAPAEAQDWLASWFGVALDPAWDEDRRRLFLRHALDFFQWRGTARGLRMALRLALDECPDESIFTEDEDPTRSTVRIVEKFRGARSAQRLGTATASTETSGVGGETTTVSRWEPTQGRNALVKRYRQALTDAGLPSTGAPFPTRVPTPQAEATVWRAFCDEALGFQPAATDADTQRWRDFLARRYRRPDAYNAAYGTQVTGFAQATLPTTLPADGAPLVDWYQFETVLLPVRGAAHQFSVVLPVPRGGTVADQSARLQQAMRVVELEKPAHAVFDVKFYWAMFRLGEARLGVDTLVDLGGRAPELLAAMELGRGHLAEGYLAPRPPQDAADRRVLGRNPLVGHRANSRSDTP